MASFLLFLSLCFLGGCTAQVNQTWDDYTDGTECYFWPAPRVGILSFDPFNDLSGYLSRAACSTIIIIHCNIGCNPPSIPCNTTPAPCSTGDTIISIDTPYVIATNRPNLMIKGALDNGVSPTFAVAPPSNNFYNSTLPVSCGAVFTVQAESVSFQNIKFAISDECYKSTYDYLPDISKIPIVYEASSNGIININNVENSAAADEYGNDVKTLIAFFSSDDETNVNIKNIVVENSSPAILFLNFLGTFTVDASVKKIFVEGSANFNKTNADIIWLDAFTKSIIDPVKDMNCPATKQTDSRACDKKKETNLILEIFVGIISGLIFIFCCFMVWRKYHHHHVEVNEMRKHGITNLCQSVNN
tara:strand:- start:65 stop:1141 length:1077 start_codon:yes stop_codon:yes gene_type:complete